MIFIKITCTLSIIDNDIGQYVKSVNPENNPENSKHSQLITYILENNDSISYSFENFENINTLRLSLEDLLEHLSFSKKVTQNYNKKKKSG